ncbi:14-3-3 domain-containing protein [Favolaschia claudopus]|uniref:14-3-3 domain-containing protein n=1 Tax=Favolaschia claudopus TaxID=2862362 RepID=A0AAV9ZPU6_9AGAR
MSALPTPYGYLAALACQAGSSNDMLDFVKAAYCENSPLAVEEHCLILMAYDKTTYRMRRAWRDIYSIENVEQREPRLSELTRRFRYHIQRELMEHCEHLISLVESYLLPTCTPESRPDQFVLYHRTIGDYARYMAEVSNENEQGKFLHRASSAYTIASRCSHVSLSPIDPHRLGLEVNLSVFRHDTLSRHSAVETVIAALLAARNHLRTSNDRPHQESLRILSLLHRNLETWLV